MTVFRFPTFLCRITALVLLVAPLVAHARSRALLVGVSEYPLLGEQVRLHGPENDVALLRSVLIGQGFDSSDIIQLSESGKGGKPTRNRILSVLDSLAGVSGDGDFAYLHFSGHGSQVPAANRSLEPDGLDEVLLPRDVGSWDEAARKVPGAILDDEVGERIQAFRMKGTFVWAVFDACHSGTMTRDLDEVRYRSASPAVLKIPASALPATTASDSSFLAAPSSAKLPKGGMVAFSAAQPTEKAPEKPLPLGGGADRRDYGVLTYLLASNLVRGGAGTYGQLAQQLVQDYRGMAVWGVTPAFEGSLDAGLFGRPAADPVRQWRLERKGNRWTVPAGWLHGIDSGASLVVLPSATSPEKDSVGRFQVSRVTAFAADGTFRTDSAFGRMADPTVLWTRRQTCSPALGLKVHFSPSSARFPSRKGVRDSLRAFVLRHSGMVEVGSEKDADLEVSLRRDTCGAALVGFGVARDPIATDCRTGLDTVRLGEILLKSTRFLRMSRLLASAPRDTTFRLVATRRGDSLAQNGGMLKVRENDNLGYRFQNRTKGALWMNIVALNLNTLEVGFFPIQETNPTPAGATATGSFGSVDAMKDQLQVGMIAVPVTEANPNGDLSQLAQAGVATRGVRDASVNPWAQLVEEASSGVVTRGLVSSAMDAAPVVSMQEVWTNR